MTEAAASIETRGPTRTRSMPAVDHSRLLQILLDAEKPVRVAVGDERELQVRSLHSLGLIDYRKSGWWTTSEAGHRLVGGSVCVEGFLVSLERLATRLAAQHGLNNRPSGLPVKAQRQRAAIHRSAVNVLGWLRTGRA